MRLLVFCLIASLVFCGCGPSRPDGPSKFDEDEAQSRYDKIVETRSAEIMKNQNLSEEEKQKRIEEVKQFARGQMNQVRQINQAIDGDSPVQDDRDSQSR